MPDPPGEKLGAARKRRLSYLLEVRSVGSTTHSLGMPRLASAILFEPGGLEIESISYASFVPRWVAMFQRLPKASFTVARRTPQGWSAGSCKEVAPAASALR